MSQLMFAHHLQLPKIPNPCLQEGRSVSTLLGILNQVFHSEMKPGGNDRRLVQPPERGGDPLAELPEHHGLGA